MAECVPVLRQRMFIQPEIREEDTVCESWLVVCMCVSSEEQGSKDQNRGLLCLL